MVNTTNLIKILGAALSLAGMVVSSIAGSKETSEMLSKMVSEEVKKQM